MTHVHFIGIGGSGLSAIARLLLEGGYTVGGSDRVLEMYRAIYEGHIEQYSALRTRDVPMGRQGMYVREFPPQLDWQHISEGLSVFNLMGLSTPQDRKLIERTRRFAGFYDGGDPAASAGATSTRARSARTAAPRVRTSAVRLATRAAESAMRR